MRRSLVRGIGGWDTALVYEGGGGRRAASGSGRSSTEKAAKGVAMSAMQRLGGVLSTAGLVGAFVVLAPAAAAQAPAPAPAATAGEVGAANADRVSWGRCSDPTLVQVGARCAKIEVPLDYDRPNGKTIKLAVSRVRHTTPDAQFQGIMLVNPGGPGGSGLILSILGGFVPGGAGDGYDWIGFDPRGVGASQGALSCDPGYFSYDRPAYIPTTAQLEKVWLDRSKAYAAACGRKNGALLCQHDDDRRGQGHGEHPSSPRAGADQLLRLLLRHVPRPGVRHAVPRAGAPHGAGQQRRSPPGVVPVAAWTRTAASTAT